MIRKYLDFEDKKIKEEDRRFLLNISHNEVLFSENMLLQNRILVFAIFALFVSLLALIIPLEYISNLLKISFVTILSILSLTLLILFFKAINSVKEQKGKIESSYDKLFKDHFSYIKKNN